MKKFSKMLALGLAAVLVFGMTAQAAGSTSGDTTTAAEETLKDNASVPSTVVVDGTEVTITAPTPLTKAQSDAAQQAVTSDSGKAQMKDKISLDSKEELVGEPKVVAAFNLEAPAGLTAEQLKAGVEIPFTLKEGVKDNMKYVAFHYTSATEYEVLPATVKNGQVCVVFHSFSPVVIVAQEVKVNTTSATNNTTNSNTAASTDPATAPKTGEAAPVAGVMALILMAGAVICAKKVRYNR